ncbi:MAG: MarR family transcriptional regulator [Hyphomicrobiaceae bacterium]
MRPHVDHTAAPDAAGAGDDGKGEGRPRRLRPAVGAARAPRAGIAPALGPLANLIGYALRRAQLAVFDETIRGIADLDLRLAQFSVLAVVGNRPGLKQSEVAAVLGIQRANFVALLDRLEKRGLARRAPAPNDRRGHALHLTAEGERVLARAGARVAAIEARLDAKLGPGGRERLLDMLWRLADDCGTPKRP